MITTEKAIVNKVSLVCLVNVLLFNHYPPIDFIVLYSPGSLDNQDETDVSEYFVVYISIRL